MFQILLLYIIYSYTHFYVYICSKQFKTMKIWNLEMCKNKSLLFYFLPNILQSSHRRIESIEMIENTFSISFFVLRAKKNNIYKEIAFHCIEYSSTDGELYDGILYIYISVNLLLVTTLMLIKFKNYLWNRTQCHRPALFYTRRIACKNSFCICIHFHTPTVKY